MDQKYLPIPIADPIYNFVQIFYLSVNNFTILWPIFPQKCKILVTDIHFVILPIADTNIFGRYSRYTNSRYNIGATLINSVSLSCTHTHTHTHTYTPIHHLPTYTHTYT